MKLLPLLLVGGLVAYIAQIKKFADKLTFKFLDIKLDWPKTLNSGLTKLFLEIKISFKNESEAELKLLKIYSDVYYDNQRIGIINQSSTLPVAKKAITETWIPVSFNVLKSVTIFTTLLKSVIGGKKVSFILTFKGYVDLTAGRKTFVEKKTLSL